MLERVARAFDVDTATSKATCVDLMRANPFDVLVASERLADGSGLELLSHVTSRWPDTLRVLAIEPQRLKLLRGKLAPFRLHAAIRYPIDEDELEASLKRMYELLRTEEETATEQQHAPTPVAAARTPPLTLQTPKVSAAQTPAKPSSRAARTPAPASPTLAHRETRVNGNVSLGAPRVSIPPPVRRKLGNYTPLGAPEDAQMRIVEREFDQTMAPLAARAIRTREEATRTRTPKEKLALMMNPLREVLRRLLGREGVPRRRR